MFCIFDTENMTSYCGNKLGRARLHSKKEEEEKSPVLLFCVCVLHCYLQNIRKGEKEKKSKRKPVGGVFSLLVKFKTRLFFHYYSNVFEELKK